MPSTPDAIPCPAAGHDAGAATVPVNPYLGLNVHYGMLMGVDDFETLQGFPVGKARLHTAWLHREGVVWGYAVAIDLARREVRVAPGLAHDAAGHDLHLDSDACLDLGAWYDAHKDDADIKAAVTAVPNGVKFSAHVVIRQRDCLTRPVPALIEPCQESGTGTAYARVFETVELLLLIGLAPPRKPPYHRLRLLFGVDAPAVDGNSKVTAEDQGILDERAAIRSKASADQPAATLSLFRRCALLDEIDDAMKPAMATDGTSGLFPDGDRAPVTLANLVDVTLTKAQADGPWALAFKSVEQAAVRPTLIATATIQELLCGVLLGPGDAGGPRGLPGTVTLSAAKKTVSFQVTKILHAKIDGRSYAVSCFKDDTGWKPLTVAAATFDGATKTVTVTVNEAFEGKLCRLIAQGTGPTPVLGADFVPLAGAVGGPAGTRDQGVDFVVIKTI